MGRHFVRPVPQVLEDDALVPRDNLVSRPALFTHAVKRETAYRYADGRGASDGHLAAGTRVALVDRGAAGRCRVIDARGLRVYVACSALRAIVNEE
jgi:hypothetical protein